MKDQSTNAAGKKVASTPFEAISVSLNMRGYQVSPSPNKLFEKMLLLLAFYFLN